jgi:acetyl esterase/lipase
MRASRYWSFSGAILALALVCAPGAANAQEFVISLWEDGAPGAEARRDEPEIAQDWWVRNVHNPSLTAFLPAAETATGAAVIIIPGGGHREVVFPPEGLAPAVYFQHMGVAAFALKYRLADDIAQNGRSPYSIEDAAADARRAMRVVRAHTEEWGVDPNRIGIMGWSAGGELASMVTYGDTDGDARAVDPIDRVSAAPDFQIIIYPGGRGIPDALNATPPPAFFLAANDDVGPAGAITRLLELYRGANGSAEVHLYAQGGHAFNMGDRSDLRTISTWPQRMADWMADSGLLAPAD